MTDTSFLQFSSPFIDPKTGVLQRWAHQYLLNPSVSNINVAAGGTFNAPGATVVAHAISLGVPVRPSSGGTGISTGTSGGILGFTSATTVASSALLGANQIVLGGGAGATPSTPLGLGSAHVVLHGAAGAPTWSAVDLSADVTGALPTSSLSGTISLTSQVTGVLPVANGGTNANAPGATAANNIGALAIASNLSDLNNAATARTNLGLGTMATQNANAVAITGSTIDGTTLGASTPSSVAATTVTASGQITGSSTGTACYSANGALNGATAVAGYQVSATIGSAVTAAARCFDSAPSTAAAAFTITNFNHFHARALSLGAGSAVTTHNGFVAAAGLGGVGGTLNIGFRGLLASGATNFNVFCDGTADNLFRRHYQRRVVHLLQAALRAHSPGWRGTRPRIAPQLPARWPPTRI